MTLATGLADARRFDAIVTGTGQAGPALADLLSSATHKKNATRRGTAWHLK